MTMQIVFLVVAWVSCVSAQFFPQQELSFAIQPPPVQQSFAFQQQPRQLQPQLQTQQPSYVHRAVVENAAREAQLPPHLLNPFYKNQRIATALAKDSWFTPGENLVVDREAEKIPRQRIFGLLKDAGLARRRRR